MVASALAMAVFWKSPPTVMAPRPHPDRARRPLSPGNSGRPRQDRWSYRADRCRRYRCNSAFAFGGVVGVTFVTTGADAIPTQRAAKLRLEVVTERQIGQRLRPGVHHGQRVRDIEVPACPAGRWGHAGNRLASLQDHSQRAVWGRRVVPMPLLLLGLVPLSEMSVTSISSPTIIGSGSNVPDVVA